LKRKSPPGVGMVRETKRDTQAKLKKKGSAADGEGGG